MPASQSVLEILIQAVDQSAAALSGVKNNLKDVAQSAITTGTQVGLAGAAILAPLALSIQSAGESQKIQTQLQAVLQSTAGAAGVTADQAINLSKAYEQQTTYSDEAVLSAENLLLTFTNIKDDVFPQATQAVLDISTALGQDTKDSAIQLGKALQDPVNGITALKRVGVNFSDSQRAVIKDLVDTGNTAAAQALILKEIATEFGGSSSAAATTFDGRLKQLNETIDDMKEQIGGALMPILQSLVQILIPIVKEVTDWMQAHPKLTETIVVFVGVLGGLLVVVGALLVAFGSLVLVILAIGAPILLLIGLVSLLAGIVIANWQNLVDDLEAIWEIAKAFFAATWNWIKTLFETSLSEIQAVWNGAWQGVSDFLTNIWNTIKNTVKSGFNEIITALNGFINALDSVHINIPSIAIPGTKLSTPSLNVGFSIPNIPYLAEGGWVTRPTLAMIGEAGPEAVMPLSKLGGNGNGGGTMITVNINGGIFPADQSAIKQIGDMLAKTIIQQVRVKNYQL